MSWLGLFDLLECFSMLLVRCLGKFRKNVLSEWDNHVFLPKFVEGREWKESAKAKLL